MYDLFHYLCNKIKTFFFIAPPESPVNAPVVQSNPAPVQTQVIARRSSHTTLEQDLHLSDTTDDDD